MNKSLRKSTTKANQASLSRRNTGFSLLESNPNALSIKTIVAPLDFSKAENPALQYVKSLAISTGATVYLVHVVQPLIYGDIPYVTINESELQRQLYRDIETLQVGMFKDVRTRMELRTGVPFQQITAVAEEKNADLIVMSTHGYSGITRVLLGSTAERVVRHAPCPVLVVRPKQRRKKGKSSKRS